MPRQAQSPPQDILKLDLIHQNQNFQFYEFLGRIPWTLPTKSFDAPIAEAFQQFNRSAHRGNADGMFLGRFLQNLITTGTEYQKVSLIETLLSQRYFYKKMIVLIGHSEGEWSDLHEIRGVQLILKAYTNSP